MPNTREKLIELIERAKHSWSLSTMIPYDCTFESWIADHLIAHGVTVQEWISVKDRLPEKDGDYLIFERGYLIPSIRVLSFAKDGRKVDKYDFHREWKNVWHRYDSEWGHLTIDDVTHLMPLPEQPKED